MRGDKLVMGSSASTWTCFDTAKDPREIGPKKGALCGSMLDDAKKAFPKLVPE